MLDRHFHFFVWRVAYMVHRFWRHCGATDSRSPAASSVGPAREWSGSLGPAPTLALPPGERFVDDFGLYATGSRADDNGPFDLVEYACAA